MAVNDKEGDPVGYMKRQKYTYTLLLNGDSLAMAYKATMLPTVYVIGPDGKLIYAEEGFRENANDDIFPVIEKHLADVKSRNGPRNGLSHDGRARQELCLPFLGHVEAGKIGHCATHWFGGVD